MKDDGSYTYPPLHLPARDIPVPASVSHEAQTAMAQVMAAPRVEVPQLAPDDVEGWRAAVVRLDALLQRMLGVTDETPTLGEVRLPYGTGRVEQLDADGAVVYDVLPEGAQRKDRRVFLDLHGGGWTLCGGRLCRIFALRAALRIRARVWSVDYRMPPDHPHPAPLDDCLTAYRHLLDHRRPQEIVLGGSSAGGNLAAALVLRARDDGLPLPAAVVLDSAALDLTASGDTWQTNLGLDDMLSHSVQSAMLLYAAEHDLRDPRLSPLFGDFGKGFPPTLLASGTRDVLLSDSVRMHRALRAAGIPAELHLLEAAGHGKFAGIGPEYRELSREIRAFADAHWSAG
ncbi:hypothetical protein GCM10010129_00340 [Streptomyces fumigatiscleroticus]|nr:hypothetical protein GCM10010129_00340 [Streptomyces fumigatiscleroticus]